MIPFGGSSGVGARGYVACARELQQQLPDLDTVVVALGSGGTMAGLVAALGPDKVLGIDTGAMPDPLPAVARFAAEAGEEPVDSGALRARFDQVGSGYGDLVESVAAAMSLIATTEGIVLDPIYTGRALAGLIAAVDDGDITSAARRSSCHRWTSRPVRAFGHGVLRPEPSADIRLALSPLARVCPAAPGGADLAAVKSDVGRAQRRRGGIARDSSWTVEIIHQRRRKPIAGQPY